MTLSGLIQRYRRCKLKWRGVSVDRTCFVHSFVSIGAESHTDSQGVIEIGSECELGFGSALNPWGGKIRIGRNVFLGPHVVIYGHGGVEIGDNTLIAMHCCIVSSNHSVPAADKIIRSEPDILLPTRIGRDVWLGAGVKVLGGVTIGNGCVVGAGSVVTKELPPYSIAVGVPARVIGKRD